MPVILVHGSPGTSRVFGSVTPALAPSFRVIVPDLPGFGASTHELPDYSFRAHAQYILELLDELRIRKAQLVGFSMGGGVVLSMADIAPERVASIVLLSAIGVQEQELLGSYWVNHVLHGAQLGALWLLREGAPHFGVLDQFPLDTKYARNFYDSDQRPLRSILQRYKGPMLILHGNGDPLVPVAAALEHHHLVPQSQLKVIDGDHFMVFQRPRVILEPMEDFLRLIAQAAQS
jgi:pimeloyl-ACP methyl ester carboxylesterase